MIKESWSNLRLSIYIGEKDRYQGQPLYKFIVQKLREIGIIGATVLRGIYGYGRKSRLHSSNLLELSSDMPIVIQSIDEGKKIQDAFNQIKPFIKEGLIIVEPVTVVFITPDQSENHESDQ